MLHSTRLLRSAIVLAIALSAALPAAARTRTSDIRIDNFGRVNDHLYRGAEPSAAGIEALARLGVKTVIDLQEADGNPSEPRLVQAAGMTYVRIPMSTHRAPTREQLALFFQLANDPARPAYVHCKGGRHRTGVMTAAYRMAFDRWSPDRAFAEMKSFKFGADFLHPEFKKYVYAFDAARAPLPANVVATQQN